MRAKMQGTLGRRLGVLVLVSTLAWGCGGGEGAADVPATPDAVGDPGAPGDEGGPDVSPPDPDGSDAPDLPGDPGADGDDPGSPDTAEPGDVPRTDVWPDPLEPGTPVPLEASAGYKARQAEYLQVCSDENGPGQGDWAGQVCRVATGQSTYNDAALDAAIERMNARQDTSDFRLAALVRMLYLDRQTGALPQELRTRIQDTLLGFKYWLDEPGKDAMCYWTENHQALFHSGEFLVGQLFPETAFGNDGKTGAMHMAHAARRLHRWLDLRGRIGFSEWHSNVYFNEDIPALVNLADFAEDESIRTKAAMVLDVLAVDLLSNMHDGLFATVMGRTYPSKFLDRLNDSTAEAAWILLGLGNWKATGNFGAAFLATSPRYFPPPILEDLAQAVRTGPFEHRQRDSIDLAEGPEWGISYEGTDDVVIWAGMGVLAAPELIEGMVAMLEEEDLWDGFLFNEIPDDYLSLLRDNRGMGVLPDLAESLAPVSRGMALQRMSTYTYRTPDYQLSGAQDYHPTDWGTQTRMWLATLDPDCYVFTSFPAVLGLAGDLSRNFAGKWHGGYHPRATFDRNVGVIQYRLPGNPAVEDLLSADRTHAFFPKDRFDEFLEGGSWVFGRKGDGYVALASRNPTRWADDDPVEWIADGTDNVFVVELGRAADHGSFADFAAAILAADLSFPDGGVSYDSPSLGRVEVAWEGPMTVNGAPVDLGPFARFDNAHVSQAWGSPQMLVTLDDAALVLDFARVTRRGFALP